MHTLNKLSACILTGTLILSGMTSTVKADETRINTDHNTYYIGNVEYNEDGTIVDASHVCNMQVETPPTTDGNDTEVTPDPEPSEPTEPVTPAPTPEPQPPKEDGGTTDKPETLKPLRKKAGLVFQFPEYQLFEETILKDIIFGPKNFGVNEEEAIEIAKETLELVGLDESYLEKSPFDLSGGQKRRVAIAGILAMNPDILILDEPTAGLDPQGAKEMLNLFQKINQQGKTVILVSHDMNQVLEYCDDVVVMNKGRVEKHVTVDELFRETEYLTSLSIDLPMITSFILELNANGYHIDPSLKDINQLIEEIGGQINE